MKRLSLIFSLLLVTSALMAQQTNVRDYITVWMVPNHSDWIYAAGEDIHIELSVRRANCALPEQEVALEWGPELREPEKQWTQATGKNGVVVLKLKGQKAPGFKTLKASVEYEGKRYTNTINVAIAPEQIKPTCSLPADFRTFWDNAIAEARRVPLKPVMTPRPELSTADYDAYEVCFQNDAANHHMYGLLQVPRGHEGERMPVVIEWPGAGVKPHKGISSPLPEKGYIILEMGVNGIPVTMNDDVYKELRYNALADYQTIRLDDRDKYYYKRIYVGTVRTVDFLETLPFVDTDRIAVTGGSQGGALSIVHAALDKRVKCLSAAYPALCEMAGYRNGRVGGWPGLRELTAQQAAVTEYYDVVNFARMLTQPIKLFIGYNDRVCCPTSTYAAYNVVSAQKELYVAQDCAHWQYPEHRVERHLWLSRMLTSK